MFCFARGGKRNQRRRRITYTLHSHETKQQKHKQRRVSVFAVEEICQTVKVALLLTVVYPLVNVTA